MGDATVGQIAERNMKKMGKELVQKERDKVPKRAKREIIPADYDSAKPVLQKMEQKLAKSQFGRKRRPV